MLTVLTKFHFHQSLSIITSLSESSVRLDMNLPMAHVRAKVRIQKIKK